MKENRDMESACSISKCRVLRPRQMRAGQVRLLSGTGASRGCSDVFAGGTGGPRRLGRRPRRNFRCWQRPSRVLQIAMVSVPRAGREQQNENDGDPWFWWGEVKQIEGPLRFPA